MKGVEESMFGGGLFALFVVGEEEEENANIGGADDMMVHKSSCLFVFVFFVL